jgi:hypothetical protein
MSSIEGLVAPIRASNASAMETSNAVRKTTQRKMLAGLMPTGSQKRKRAAEEEAETPKAPKPQKISKADVQYQQMKHKQQEQASKGYLTKLNILGRFRSSKKLWPFIMSHGDKSILNGPENNEKDLDRKLSHVDAVCSSNNAADKMKECIWLACDAFDKWTGHGAMLGMDIEGYADDVYTHLDEVSWELEIMSAKYGEYFSCPWYAALGLFFAKRARAVDSRNKMLGAHTSAGFSRGVQAQETGEQEQEDPLFK